MTIYVETPLGQADLLIIDALVGARKAKGMEPLYLIPGVKYYLNLRKIDTWALRMQVGLK